MKNKRFLLAIFAIQIIGLHAGGTILSNDDFQNTRTAFTLTLHANPEDGGEVIGSGMYEPGEVIYIQAIQSEGWGFYNWTKNGEHFAWVQNFTFTMPEEDVELTAHFKPLYTLTLLVSPEGAGNVLGAGNYIEGKNVNILASAEYGYLFYSWQDSSGQAISYTPSLLYTMPAQDVTLTATFIEDQIVYINELPWYEDFEEGVFPPLGWSVVDIQGIESWTLQIAPAGGFSAYHVYGDLQEDTWLISPAIVMPPNGIYNLSFRSYNYWASWYPGFGANSVMISNGSPNPLDENFTLAWSTETVEEAWVETFIDISEYTGDTIYVAFRYYADYTHDWYVDDVKIDGLPQIVLSAESFEVALEPNTTETLELVIENIGYGRLDYTAFIQLSNKKATKPVIVANENPGSVSWELTTGNYHHGGEPEKSSRNFVLHYDGANFNGVGLNNGGTIMAAARFPAEMTALFSGYILKTVDIFLSAGAIENTLKIWGQGTEVAPGELLYELPFETANMSWVNVSLPEEVVINAEDLWVGYSVFQEAGSTPLGFDAGPAVIDGDWLFINNAWQRMSLISQFNGNFNIRANLTLGNFWMGISQFSGTISPGQTESLFISIDAINLEQGNYHADIILNCNDPDNHTIIVPITLDIITGIDQPEKQPDLIYPVPTKDYLKIDTKREISYIEVFSSLGQHVATHRNINHQSTQLPVSQLQPGNYTLNIRFKDGKSLTKNIIIY